MTNDELKRLMRERKITISTLAKVLNVAGGTIADTIAGKVYDPELMQRISVALGVNTEQIKR